MNNKVSVVIPVYNGEKFIEESIESALNQSYKPFEVIVINDGSKDGTAKHLAQFGDRITTISIPNGGVSNARNTGIRASSGDLIAFLDADDVWYENKLEHQLSAFETYPDVGFSCCNYQALNKSNNTEITKFTNFDTTTSNINFDTPLKRSALEVLIELNFVGTCSNVIIKRSVLDTVGLFNTSYRQAEDYDLWLRCALVTDFLVQSSVLLKKRSHDNNLTNNFLETLHFHEKVLIALQSNNLARKRLEEINDQYQQALALVRYEIGNLTYNAGQRRKAFGYYFFGFRSYPTMTNFLYFSHYFLRKLARTLSFGLLRNRK